MNLEPYYVTHKKYSITLNPIDKYQFLGHQHRVKRFRNFVYEQLLGYPGTIKYWIEISEPRGMHTQGKSGPRLHIHGYFEFDSRKQIGHFLTHTFYALLRWTSVDIDTIDDLSKWESYCKKQKLIRSQPHIKTDEDESPNPDTFVHP